MGGSALSERLEAKAQELFDRHVERSREWFPHELVRWELGEADPDAIAAQLESDGVRSALLINLLTEDNLPHYFYAVASTFGEDSVMFGWARRWAAEEQRHSIVLRDWLCISRQVNLTDLERLRMAQVSRGFDPGIRRLTICDGLLYLTVQELATRVSYRNTANAMTDIGGQAVMQRVASDENLHFLFYRDMASEAFEEDPSGWMVALDRQISNFQMPGTEIPGFPAHAAAIASVGIYDYTVHYEQILDPLVRRHWKVENLCGLDSEAEKARDHLMAWMTRLGRVARRMAEQREKSMAE